jgi:excisionase family DNA binding protein
VRRLRALTRRPILARLCTAETGHRLLRGPDPESSSGRDDAARVDVYRDDEGVQVEGLTSGVAFRSRFPSAWYILGTQSGAVDAGSVRWVTVRELAAMLRVSRSTVYQAVAAGEIPHVRVRNAIRIPVATTWPGEQPTGGVSTGE